MIFMLLLNIKMMNQSSIFFGNMYILDYLWNHFDYYCYNKYKNFPKNEYINILIQHSHTSTINNS